MINYLGKCYLADVPDIFLVNAVLAVGLKCKNLGASELPYRHHVYVCWGNEPGERQLARAHTLHHALVFPILPPLFTALILSGAISARETRGGSDGSRPTKVSVVYQKHRVPQRP